MITSIPVYSIRDRNKTFVYSQSKDELLLLTGSSLIIFFVGRSVYSIRDRNKTFVHSQSKDELLLLTGSSLIIFFVGRSLLN